MDDLKSMFFGEGAVWMWAICVISIICIALLIERFYFIFIKFGSNGRMLMNHVQNHVMSGNIDAAIQVCNAAGASAVAQVMKAGLSCASRSEIEIQNRIEEATLEVVPNVTRFLPALASLANIATLLGLLGTIIGLISAFGSLASAAPDERQAKLSNGIAVAMNTTAFGLIVAIPTLTFHVLLSARATKIISDIELYSTKLGNLLAARK